MTRFHSELIEIVLQFLHNKIVPTLAQFTNNEN